MISSMISRGGLGATTGLGFPGATVLVFQGDDRLGFYGSDHLGFHGDGRFAFEDFEPIRGVGRGGWEGLREVDVRAVE